MREYGSNINPDLAERSAFCKHCYKQIYTYLFVDDHKQK